jgi:flagellar L-ring protein FlgH
MMLAACMTLIVLPATAQTSMFADPTARNVGDIVTIVLEERTAAQRESAWQNQSDASMGGDAQVDAGPIAGAFGADASFNTGSSNRNESVQSDLLRGTISAQVVEIDQAGNLVIEGERTLNVNGETHLLHVSGIVRPFDVRYDNSVLSTQIAAANIVYEREGGGVMKGMSKPGAFARIGAAVALVAAIFFAF